MKNLPALLPLFALLGGCSLASIGAGERAHREEAALHKILDGQTSYALVVQTMNKREETTCNERAMELLADRNGHKFIPPKPGRHIVCNRSFDWNTPRIACSWRLLFNASAIENDSVQDISIDVYKACN